MRILGRFFLGLLALLLVAQFAKVLLSSQRRCDLGLVVDAAARLAHGETLYPYSEYLPHTKSPLATFVFTPLTVLPTPVLDRAWDLLLVACMVWLFAWASRQVEVQAVSRAKLATAVLFTTFNPLNTEIAFGQFNLLLLLATVASVYGAGQSWAGAGFAFSVFFKPTQIVYLPWIARFHSRRLQWLLGGVAGVALTAIIYCALHGAGPMVQHFRMWASQTGAVTPYHLGRPDNYGLPSLFVFFGMPASYWPVFQVLGLVVSYGICRRVANPFEALAWTSCVTVIMSPMAWLHVYVMTVPFVFLLWKRFFDSPRDRALVVAAIAAYYWGTEFFNPTTEKISFLNWMFFNRPPLFGLLTAMALFSVVRTNQVRK
jgi:hypothetical protein